MKRDYFTMKCKKIKVFDLTFTLVLIMQLIIVLKTLGKYMYVILQEGVKEPHYDNIGYAKKIEPGVLFQQRTTK